MAAFRGIKNVVGNYTNGEIKVREATTNETWGPTTAQLAEISDISYQLLHFHEVMSMIEKRLNDKGKNYRHVAKALLVLDYVIKTGPERVIQYWKDKLYIITTLKDFQFTDKEAKDQGRLIRDRAKQITMLLNDNDLLLAEREKALETKKKFHSADLAPASSNDPTSRSWEPERKSFQPNSEKPGSQPGSTSNLSADIKAALPINKGEEHLQLQLALALSKEDSDTKAQTVVDEENEIKSAIQISRSEVEPQKITPGMIAPPPGTKTAEPWLSLPEPSNPRAAGELGDPWGGVPTLVEPPAEDLVLGDQPDLSDPWTGELRGRLDSPAPDADPWGDLTSAPSVSPALKPVNLTNEIVMGPDPWGGSNKPAESGEVGLLDRPISPPNSSILLPLNETAIPGGVNTVESEFLGQNAKLVNLDALVDLGRAPAAGSGQEGNPFAMLPPDTSAKQPASNPFLANVTPHPTLNQMRDTSKPDPLQAPLIPSANTGSEIPTFSTIAAPQPLPPTAQSSQGSDLASVFQNPLPPSMFPPAGPQLGQNIGQIGQTKPGPDYSALAAPTNPYAAFGTANQPTSAFGTANQPTSAFGTAPTQPVQGFGTTSQPVQGFGTTSQPVQGFGTTNQPVPGFGTANQPVSAFGTANQPVQGFGTTNQPVSAFGTANQPVPGFGTASTQPASGFPDFPTGQPAQFSGSPGHAGFGPLQGAPTGTAHNYGGNPSFPQSSNPFF